jgi:hypothetical protein
MGEKARALRVDMPIAVSCLLMSEEALGHDEMKIVFGAGHGHIE